MASAFNCKPNESAGQLKRVREFVPLRSEDYSPSSGCETWTCEFSPDGTFFGWSSGNRNVTLVPTATLTESRNVISLNSGSNQQTAKQISIDCGYLVRSLTFAVIDDLDKSSAFWPRTAHEKSLFLITGHCNGRIRVWDVVTGNLLLQLLDHKDIVSCLDVVQTGKGFLASASFDGTVKIWDMIDEGNLSRTITMGGKAVYSCTWSHDGKSLVSVGMDKNVYVWNVDKFTVRLQLTGHQHNIVSCDFSPDSCLIATASWDTRVIIWDAKSGAKLREFLPPPRLIYASGENGNWIRSLSFGPDGAHLATVSDDGLVRVWDLNNDDAEATATVEQGLCCSFSTSGHLLAVGTRGGAVSIYETKSCIKPLLFLCRTTIRKNDTILSSQFNSKTLPGHLLDYILYKDLE